jgi:hypothetical protein
MSEEALARREAENAKPLQEVYETAVKKALTSSSASERTQALAQAGAMLTPTLGELRAKIKELEDAREAAESALKTAQDAVSAANAKVAELEPIAARVVELETFKADVDSWKAEQVRALTEEATKKLWAAERARNEAQNTLQSAQRQFSNKGFEVLMEAMRDLVAANNLPQPDIWNLPKNVNPLLLTLWPGWTPIKASLFVGFMKSYPEPNDFFKQALERCLKERLPAHSSGILIPLERLGIESDSIVTNPRSEPRTIEHLTEKIEVLTMMASRWPGVLEEVQRRVEAEQVRRQADFLRAHNSQLARQASDMARMGYGRSEIGVQEDVSITGLPPDEPCLEGCICPHCQPGLKRPGSLDALDSGESF